ncbi:hypothetical protein VWZ88_14650 [Phaeobacter sp. JH20_36]|uniref:hypothetical protein n=1 Tax=unclassified Phaeobacter TaxID=2621772 RepID=UPI003A83D816
MAFQEQWFAPKAANSGSEPDPAILFLCCVRSQREKCGMSEKLHAVAQQNKRPFVQVAASIKRRTYRSRDWADIAHPSVC